MKLLRQLVLSHTFTGMGFSLIVYFVHVVLQFRLGQKLVITYMTKMYVFAYLMPFILYVIPTDVTINNCDLIISNLVSSSEKCRKYFVSCKPLFTYTWFSKGLSRFSVIRAIDLLGHPKVWGGYF